MARRPRMTMAAATSTGSVLLALSLALGGCGSHAGGSPSSTSGSHGGGSPTTGASTSSTSSTTTTTSVHLTGPITVVEVGDSLGIDLGWGMSNALANDTSVKLVQGGYGDSGLVEPQFYNWPVHLEDYLTADHPQVVVVFLGANDVQNFWDGSTLETFGTASWAAAYGERVATMMQEATSAGARVLWVGMPIMQDPTFSSHMQFIDGIYAREAASHPGVTYFSSWNLFATPSGQYTGTEVVGGQTVTLRDPDGIHIATGGLDVLGEAVVTKLQQLYGMS